MPIQNAQLKVRSIDATNQIIIYNANANGSQLRLQHFRLPMATCELISHMLQSYLAILDTGNNRMQYASTLTLRMYRILVFVTVDL